MARRNLKFLFNELQGVCTSIIPWLLRKKITRGTLPKTKAWILETRMRG